MTTQSTEPVLSFADGSEWESWLERNHDGPAGVWIKIAKKGAGVASVTIRETLDGALCYGWIDSQRKGLDESSYLQRYSRRRPGSPWSRVNVERAEELIAAGRMRAPGFAEIGAAKADGRWEQAYERQATATVPPDLAAALERAPKARAAFEALDKTGRYLVMLPILKARTPQARATRVDKAITELSAALLPCGDHEG